jgi:hypothetical protein
MNKNILFILAVSLVLASTVVVLAKPDFVSIDNPSGNDILVPENAVQISEGVFSLGQARDVDGRLVQGFMFVDDKKGHAKPPWAGGGKKDNGGSTCYSLFAKGARWKTTESYITGTGVNLNLMQTSADTWDSEVSFDVFGTGASGETDGADNVAPDGKNEVELQNLGPSNTIAYTIVWGIFSGPPRGRVLVEWDMVFNTDYAFGDADSDSSVMDFQNIATHELGHSLGLGHPDGSCTEETMYAYAGFGETKKRTLEAGDISGVNELY